MILGDILYASYNKRMTHTGKKGDLVNKKHFQRKRGCCCQGRMRVRQIFTRRLRVIKELRFQFTYLTTRLDSEAEYKLGHYRNITLEVGLPYSERKFIIQSIPFLRPPTRSKLGMLRMTYFTVSLTSIRIILCLK